MANWAIVIGVDKYWQPAACLRGAVNDALKMRTWLLDPNGGNVPPANLTLLLAPDQTEPPADVIWTPATSDNIVVAIEELLDRSASQGERLYLHFSGHGLTARIGGANLSGIVATDFTNKLTDKTLTLWSLFELFQATKFKEQFFFVDACRNIPFATEKRLRDYPNPRKPVPPVSPQFIMYATMPGLLAVEIRAPGNEHGAFTNALLAGLSGTGNAKRWDDQLARYVVRWNSLFQYVEQQVAQRELAASKLSDPPQIQIPRQYGERGTENPVLGAFPTAKFAQENLDVDLVPSAVQGIADVAINDLAGRVDQKTAPLPSLPLRFTLPPGTYGVTASASGYVSRRRHTTVDLYGAESVKIELDPVRPPTAGPPPTDPLGPDAGPQATRGLDAVEADHKAPAPSPPSLGVSCADLLAQIEVADVSGGIINRGRGYVWVNTPKGGFYRARLVMPDGDAVEELVQVQGAEQVILRAPRPGRLVQDIASKLDFKEGPDGTISPSEAVGPVAGLKLSTVLALAAAAATEGTSGAGQRLRALGIPGFAGSLSGVQVVLGDESAQPIAWSELKLRLFPLHDVAIPVTTPSWPQIASARFACAPGGYALSLTLPGRPALTLPVHVLPGRVSLIVATRRPDDQIDLYQYMSLLPAAEHTIDPDIIARSRDPFFGQARFAAIRRIEWMQRCANSGWITPTKPDIDILLWDKWQDPIAGCLGGYLMLRMEGPAGLDVATRNLVKYFGALPDSHILRAAFLETTSPASARECYVEASKRGLPLYRDGLTLLARAGEKLGFPNFQTAWLDRVPSGALWSVVPDPIAANAATAADVATAIPPAMLQAVTSDKTLFKAT